MIIIKNLQRRRVQHLEGDLEVCEDKLLLATQKLDKVIPSICILLYEFRKLKNGLF